MVNPVNYRNRDRRPTNFEDGLMVGGVDILTLIRNTGNDQMAYSGALSLISERYVASQPGVGFSIGDILRRLEMVDTSTTPFTTTVTWFNFTKNVDLQVSPSVDAITLQQQSGLTNTELRATPLVTRTDANSPEIIRLGDTGDTPAPIDGSGEYSLIAASKRTIIHLNTLLGRLPAALGQTNRAGSVSVTLASEQEAVLANQLSRMTETKQNLDSLLTRLPTSLGLKDPSASLSVVVANEGSNWTNVGYTIDNTGRLISETESNGTITRTRSWTHTNDAGGNTISTAGAWT